MWQGGDVCGTAGVIVKARLVCATLLFHRFWCLITSSLGCWVRGTCCRSAKRRTGVAFQPETGTFWPCEQVPSPAGNPISNSLKLNLPRDAALTFDLTKHQDRQKTRRPTINDFRLTFQQLGLLASPTLPPDSGTSIFKWNTKFQQVKTQVRCFWVKSGLRPGQL